MNLVLLCKRHNHAKAVDLLTAFKDEGLPVRGVIALAAPRRSISLTGAIRKMHERVCRPSAGAQQPQSQPNTPPHRWAQRPAANGNAFTLAQNNFAALAADQKLAGAPPVTLADHARRHRIPLRTVRDLNGTECEQAVRELQTGLLILGGVPIVRQNILAIPQAGTLNVHMGWLPDMRGMNVAEWSILLNKPVAVSVHFVDAGVDTGAILYREKFDTSAYRNLAGLRQQLSLFQHRVLAHAARLLLEQRLQPIPQKPEAGKQYYLMHPRLRALAEKKLQGSP